MKKIENELIPVYENEKSEKLVNARELHEFLEVDTRFNDWIKEKISKYDFTKDIDFTSFTEKSVKPQGGRPTTEYILTLDTAKEISMVENNSKGKEARKYFIAVEKKYQNVVKPLTPQRELKLHYEVLMEHDEEIKSIKKDIVDIKENSTLSAVECKELQDIVRKTGTSALGGHGSPAYNDRSIRTRVYADIQFQLKREFGVRRYEAIKRCKFETAKNIISSYKAPTVLQDQITLKNNQLGF